MTAIQENRDNSKPANDKRKIESECLKHFIRLITDDKSRLIFGTISLMNGESSEVLIDQLNLTRKQFYSRMSRLVKARLIRREKGKYFVTSYGTVIHDILRLLENAVKNYWKLKSLDLIEVANKNKMPKEERVKIIGQLITNQQIKRILLSGS